MPHFLQRLYRNTQVVMNVARPLLYRLTLNHVGRNLVISKHVIISAPNKLSIGNNVFVNIGCIFHAEGNLSIGDDTKIGPYTTIWTSNHIFDRTDVPIRTQGHSYAPVTIGRDVWIGAGVTIVAGVTVGDGAVVGAGSVVTRDIAPYSVAVGNPARVIRSRLG